MNGTDGSYTPNCNNFKSGYPINILGRWLPCTNHLAVYTLFFQNAHYKANYPDNNFERYPTIILLLRSELDTSASRVRASITAW
jgi:hypothetical protein